MDNDEQHWQGLLRKSWITNTLILERLMSNELTGEAYWRSYWQSLLAKLLARLICMKISLHCEGG